MEELGFAAATSPHRGGEIIALEMLDKIIADETYTATFEKPNTAPTAFEPQATTLLSPHLHFGSLSVREFYWRIQDVVTNFKGKASQPPISLSGYSAICISPHEQNSGIPSTKRCIIPTAVSFPGISRAKWTIRPSSSPANTTSIVQR